MNVHTVSARAAAALVATIAGAASWEHIASVAYSAGERPWVAYSLPAAVDGLIVVGVAALLEDRKLGNPSRWRARLAVITGVLATLAANIASAEPGLTAALVAVAAPVSFLLSVEVLTRTGRPVSSDVNADITSKPAAGDSPESPGQRRERPRRTPGKKAAAEKVTAARERHPAATQAELSKKAKVSVRTVARHDPGRKRDETGAANLAAPDGHKPGVPVMADA